MDDNFPPTPDLSAAIVAERLRLRIPSRPEWIAPTVEFLKQWAGLCGACQPARDGKLMLALHEALSNAVIHGNLELSSELKEHGDAFARALAERSADSHYSARVVSIEVDYDGERCEWTISDEGQGFDAEHYLSGGPPDEAELWLASGRGILLMRAFLDSVRYEAGGRRAILTLQRGSGMEKRQHSRQSLQHPVQVAPIRGDGSVDWDAAWDAVTQNLSSEGVGLLQALVTHSDRVLLGVEVEGRPVYIPAQVRHCRPLEGMVELGCRFLPEKEPLPSPPSAELRTVEESVEALLSRPRRPPRTIEEGRSAPREPYTERIELLGAAGKPGQVGFARDLSRSGISFITTAPVALEDRLLSLPRPEGPPLRLRARVVRCTPISSGFYDVGARFLGIDSES